MRELNKESGSDDKELWSKNRDKKESKMELGKGSCVKLVRLSKMVG